MKRSGMPIISLGSINCRFWSHFLGCSGQNAIIFLAVRISLEEIIIIVMIIIVQQEWADFRFKLDIHWSLNSNLLVQGCVLNSGNGLSLFNPLKVPPI